MHKSADGGYILAGRTSSGTNNLHSDIYLVKTDSIGSPQWQKAYGANGYEEATSIAPLDNGGFILTGLTGSFTPDSNGDIFLMQIDDTGKVIWQRTYGGAFNDVGQMVKPTSDGGYIIVGAHLPPDGWTWEIYIIRTDSLGGILWTKTYNSGFAENCRYVTETIDGGYIVAGDFSDGQADQFAMKLDGFGNIIWAKSYGTSANEGLACATQTSDRGYVLAGTMAPSPSNETLGLNKIDSNGNLQWSKIYDKPQADEVSGIRQTLDGGYVLAGGTNINNKSYLLLVKTDAQGNLQWSKVTGRTGFNYAKDVEISGSGYMAAGFTSTSFQSQWTFYLIKTDGLGNSGCNTDSVAMTESISNTVTNNIIFTQSSLDSTNSAFFTISSSQGIDSTHCFHDGSNALNDPELLSLSVFPNPTDGRISFQSEKKIVRIDIVNALGAKIYSAVFNSSQALVNMNEAPNGIYFYSLQTEKESIRGKFVVNR